MSLRRATVALVVLASGALGAGVATSAVATPPCDQAPQPCQTYDTWKRTGVAFLTVTNAACSQNVGNATVCTDVALVGGTAYGLVFFPWSACADVNGTKQCVGPIG